MRIEVGKWFERKVIYLDFKKIPGNFDAHGNVTSWIVFDNAAIKRIIEAVQRVYDPWQVGIISCDTERDPRDIQRIRVLGSAKGYPSLPTPVVEIAYIGETIRPMGELDHPRPFSVFCNRLPASMKNEAGIIQVLVHAIGHGFGLEHNGNMTSWMNPTVAPRIKSFDELEIAYLNITASKDFNQSIALTATSDDPLSVISPKYRTIYEQIQFGKRCECSFV